MKPYQTIPIQECHEPLASIPLDLFHLGSPHPYQALGAPYQGLSPWFLRVSVLATLKRAQERLQKAHPGWRLSLFDALRPNAVQTYMVEREKRLVCASLSYDPLNLSDSQHAEVMEKVFRLWGMPSDHPATPPPHSTGAAVDLTLINEHGKPIDMGSPIDENSDRSHGDFFKNSPLPQEQQFDKNRSLLNDVMFAEGFMRLPREWWHFSLGDQSWAYLNRQKTPGSKAIAVYGRADLI